MILLSTSDSLMINIFRMSSFFCSFFFSFQWICGVDIYLIWVKPCIKIHSMHRITLNKSVSQNDQVVSFEHNYVVVELSVKQLFWRKKNWTAMHKCVFKVLKRIKRTKTRNQLVVWIKNVKRTDRMGSEQLLGQICA